VARICRRGGRGYAKVLIESLAPTEAGGKREQHANRQILQVTNATLKALRKLDNAIRTTVGPLATFNPENLNGQLKKRDKN
jgi:hypothetical protein